jgi:hypothetical protein
MWMWMWMLLLQLLVGEPAVPADLKGLRVCCLCDALYVARVNFDIHETFLQGSGGAWFGIWMAKSTMRPKCRAGDVECGSSFQTKSVGWRKAGRKRGGEREGASPHVVMICVIND